MDNDYNCPLLVFVVEKLEWGSTAASLREDTVLWESMMYASRPQPQCEDSIDPLYPSYKHIDLSPYIIYHHFHFQFYKLLLLDKYKHCFGQNDNKCVIIISVP